ncbi:hypothetical protein C7534_107115 [Pseudomonas sp. OV226]|jgi:hypothetical protein|nr:hypothetical protein C7534_107115 [Pseudomonas sp. OV226]
MAQKSVATRQQEAVGLGIGQIKGQFARAKGGLRREDRSHALRGNA